MVKTKRTLFKGSVVRNAISHVGIMHQMRNAAQAKSHQVTYSRHWAWLPVQTEDGCWQWFKHYWLRSITCADSHGRIHITVHQPISVDEYLLMVMTKP